MIVHRILALLAFASAPAAAQSPITGMPVAGPKSQVLTIGSVHLSGFKQWTPDMLEPLLARLASFKPAVITQEGLSGEQCAHLRAFPHLYGEAHDSYCWNPAELLGSTRMSVAEAMRAVDETLASLPASASPAQRRRLAMLFLAAGDRVSARVQWLRLPASERRPGDGLDERMIAIIERKGKAMNESYEVAAALAARLGLERVHAVDDHTSDGTLALIGEGYGKALQQLRSGIGSNPAFLEYQRQTGAVKDGATMLELYRQINRKGGTDSQVRADFGAAMAQQTPELWGRQYVGWWDVRNLRMVANIRAAFAGRPGVRVLNIVGSAHKAWYDLLLAQMADVEVVDAQSVLGE